jgi:hypothetical protein
MEPGIRQTAESRCFKIIFTVPTLDHIDLDQDHFPFLMNLNAGTVRTHHHTFSSPELDLAVISLDGQKHSLLWKFRDALFNLEGVMHLRNFSIPLVHEYHTIACTL